MKPSEKYGRWAEWDADDLRAALQSGNLQAARRAAEELDTDLWLQKRAIRKEQGNK